MTDLLKKFEDQETRRQERYIESVRKWLSTAKPEDNYQDAIDRRQLPLGGWLIKHSKFKEWQASSVSSLLVVHGLAGTGKTGLVCRVIKTLQAQMQNDEFSRLAYFFCSNDQAAIAQEDAFSRSDPSELLRSVVSQVSISFGRRAVAPAVKEKYEAFGKGTSDVSRKLKDHECLDALADIAQETPITIVVDAVDELIRDHSYEIFDYFRSLIERAPKHVKIFISTRSFPAIEQEIQTWPSLEVDAENNGEDVREFIKATLDKRIQDKSILKGQVPEQLRNDIESTLSYRAQNMFLYASLLLSQLCDKNHLNDEDSIRQKLEELPKDIKYIYDGIMKEIHDTRANAPRKCIIAQNTFKWLLHAQEPLDTNSMLEAVAPKEWHVDGPEVLEACRTLVQQNKSGFEFAHYTVREHISQMVEYRPSRCHLVAADSCLRTVNDFFDEDVTQTTPNEGSHFLDYAMLFWPVHYEGISQIDMYEAKANINNLLRSLLLKGRGKVDKYGAWLNHAKKLVKKLSDHEELRAKFEHLEALPRSPLFAACVFGHGDIIGKFGRELDGLNVYNGKGQTALCLAIQHKKLDVVKTLLASRYPAEVNLLNTRAVEQFVNLMPKEPPAVIVYASALQCAAAVGALEIADFLIQQGANVDLVAGYYGSPLQAAAWNGHGALVGLLLKNAAEPNSQGGYYGNALQAAAARGHYEIIDQLLEHKPPALIHTPGGHHGNALTAAIDSGASDAVWALLEERADPNSQTPSKDSLLGYAARNGLREIVSLLLEHGAEAKTAYSTDDFHLLHVAAIHNMVDLAKYCLDQGCPIQMITTKGKQYHRKFGDFARDMTPLGFACAEGNLKMVKFLLESGASLEFDNPNSALLWTAAYMGESEVAEALIKHCKMHQPDALKSLLTELPSPKAGHPLLFAAASSGDSDVVRLLLDHGVEYKSNWFGGTPLLATAAFGCHTITQLLLDYHKQHRIDVRVNQRDGHGITALVAAFKFNQPAVARLLLAADIGVDYTIPDNGKATALHYATNHSMYNTVEVLVKQAAAELDRPKFLAWLNLRHDTGKTALLDSADRNRPRMLDLLLAHEADFETGGHAGNSPLHWAVTHGHDRIALSLIERGKQLYADQPERFKAFINRQNKDGEVPLIKAVRHGNLSTVNILLEKGSASCTITAKNQVLPIHVASVLGYADKISAMLDRIGSDGDASTVAKYVNTRDGWGKTAVMIAAEYNRHEIVKMAFDRGGEWNLISNDGWTALHYCSFRNHVDCVRTILERAVTDSKGKNDTDAFTKWLNQQGKSNGATAIRDAALQGHTRVVELILAHDPNLEIVDGGGWTPLHDAVVLKSGATTSMLLRHLRARGLDSVERKIMATKNKQGQDVLALAKQKAQQGVILTLKEYGYQI